MPPCPLRSRRTACLRASVRPCHLGPWPCPPHIARRSGRAAHSGLCTRAGSCRRPWGTCPRRRHAKPLHTRAGERCPCSASLPLASAARPVGC
eukprot:scaffold91363_cov56-Phaeocystis_antarctica.AAC.2